MYIYAEYVEFLFFVTQLLCNQKKNLFFNFALSVLKFGRCYRLYFCQCNDDDESSQKKKTDHKKKLLKKLKKKRRQDDDSDGINNRDKTNLLLKRI